jgi:hypothetical protein
VVEKGEQVKREMASYIEGILDGLIEGTLPLVFHI